MKVIVLACFCLISLSANELQIENSKEFDKRIEEHNKKIDIIKVNKALLRKFDIEVSGEFEIKFDSNI